MVVRQFRPIYENTLSLIGGRDSVPWDINGVTFKMDPHQRHCMGVWGHDVWGMGHDCKAPVVRFLRQAVKSGDVCFDVGVNVGAYALQFAHGTGSGGSVVAFEPNPAAAEVLSRQIRMNGFEGIVTIEMAVVGSACGTAELNQTDTDRMSRLGMRNKMLRFSQPVVVQMATIDEYCDRWD